MWWRKMRDSNPRNLTVRLLSKELRSTTLAIFLCLVPVGELNPACSRGMTPVIPMRTHKPEFRQNGGTDWVRTSDLDVMSVLLYH